MADLTYIDSNTYRDARNKYRSEAQEEQSRDQAIQAAQEEALARTQLDQAAMGALRQFTTPPAQLPSQTAPAVPTQAPPSPLQGVVAGGQGQPAPAPATTAMPQPQVQPAQQPQMQPGLERTPQLAYPPMSFAPTAPMNIPQISMWGPQQQQMAQQYGDPIAAAGQAAAPYQGQQQAWLNPNAPNPQPPGSPAMGYTPQPPQAQQPQAQPQAQPDYAPMFQGSAFESSVIDQLRRNPGPGTGRAVLNLVGSGRQRMDQQQSRQDEMEKVAMTALAAGDMPTFTYWSQKAGMQLPPQLMHNAEQAGMFAKGMLIAEKFYRENDDQAMRFAQTYTQSGGNVVEAYKAAGVPFGKPQYDLRTIMQGEQQVLAQIDRVNGNVRVLQGPDGQPIRTVGDPTTDKRSGQQQQFEWLTNPPPNGLGIDRQIAMQMVFAQKPDQLPNLFSSTAPDADGDGQPDEDAYTLQGGQLVPDGIPSGAP